MISSLPTIGAWNFRPTPEQWAQVNRFLHEYRKATGENINLSQVLRRCVDVGLSQVLDDLLKGVAAD